MLIWSQYTSNVNAEWKTKCNCNLVRYGDRIQISIFDKHFWVENWLFSYSRFSFPCQELVFHNIQEPKKLVLNFMTVNLINIITMLSFNHISKVTHHQIIETNLVFLRFLKLVKSAHGSNLSLPKVGRSKKTLTTFMTSLLVYWWKTWISEIVLDTKIAYSKSKMLHWHFQTYSVPDYSPGWNSFLHVP